MRRAQATQRLSPRVVQETTMGNLNLMTAQFSNYVSKSRTVQHCFELECKPNGSETRLG